VPEAARRSGQTSTPVRAAAVRVSRADRPATRVCTDGQVAPPPGGAPPGGAPPGGSAAYGASALRSASARRRAQPAPRARTHLLGAGILHQRQQPRHVRMVAKPQCHVVVASAAAAVSAAAAAAIRPPPSDPPTAPPRATAASRALFSGARSGRGTGTPGARWPARAHNRYDCVALGTRQDHLPEGEELKRNARTQKFSNIFANDKCGFY
jgi:hypothetical protein